MSLAEGHCFVLVDKPTGKEHDSVKRSTLLDKPTGRRKYPLSCYIQERLGAIHMSRLQGGGRKRGVVVVLVVAVFIYALRRRLLAYISKAVPSNDGRE